MDRCSQRLDTESIEGAILRCGSRANQWNLSMLPTWRDELLRTRKGLNLSPTPIHMKYTDHLKKIADLQQEVERLRSGKPSDDEVLNYLACRIVDAPPL